MGGLEKTIAPTTIQPTHAIPFPHPPIRGSVQLWQPMLLSSLENWPLLALCGDYSRLDTCPVDVKTVHRFSVLHALDICSNLLILVPIERYVWLLAYIPVFIVYGGKSPLLKRRTWHLQFYVFCSHRLRRELKIQHSSMLESFLVCTVILI
jgi:hypothetical protein